MEPARRNHFLQVAIQNNAAWCEIVCRSHNVPGEFHETFWVNHHTTPPFYPNLMTLAPVTDLQIQQNDLTGLLIEKQDDTVSVKDSFAVLDLSTYGFQQLFQAQWIVREAPAELLQPEANGLRWKKIVTEKELLQWEKAWAQHEIRVERLFLPALLEDEDICILAAMQEGQIVAGVIANQTEKVIGISNVFTPELDAPHYWSGLLGQVAARYPGLSIVGYERDESLAMALEIGFTTLGPLQVWLK